MAIKVNNVTVIDDSRNLVNIVSGAGPSTDLGTVGTYAFIYYATASSPGTIMAGSDLRYANTADLGNTGASNIAPPGTWRLMGTIGYFGGAGASSGGNTFKMSLAVRIS